MTMQAKGLAISTAVIFVAGIALSMAFNLWRTESTKTPVSIRSGEFAGEYDPADIRGSYTFGDIAGHFDVSVETLAEAFVVTGLEDLATYRISWLEETYAELADGGEIGTDSVRLFVALYTGLPHTPEETTRLPAPAASLLRDRLDDDAYTELRKVTVPVGDLKLSSGVAVGAEAAEHSSSDDRSIRGKTTFDDLLSWGLTKEEIESILERTMGARSATVRDFLGELGLEFSTYRTKLQELIDSKQ
jgi:hypothetical protein